MDNDGKRDRGGDERDRMRRARSADHESRRNREGASDNGRDMERYGDRDRRGSHDRNSRDRRSGDTRRGRRDRRRSGSPEPVRQKSGDRARGRDGRSGPVVEREREENRSRSRSRSRGRDRPRYRDRDRNRDEDVDSSRRKTRDRERDRDRDRPRKHGRADSPTDDEGDDGRRRRRRSRDADPRRKRLRESEGETTQSPPQAYRSSGRRRSRSPPVRRSGPLPSQTASFALSTTKLPDGGGVMTDGRPDAAAPKPKEKPKYSNTGLLAAESNAVVQADGTTITLKYHEPAEARKPPGRDQWRLVVFKGDSVVENIDLGTRSCWLVGREARVVDLEVTHPSVSGQHAVVQFRRIEKVDEFGDRKGRIRPYLIDLGSANGTVLNGEQVPPSRYLELRSKDVINLGHSTREYVLVRGGKE